MSCINASEESMSNIIGNMHKMSHAPFVTHNTKLHNHNFTQLE